MSFSKKHLAILGTQGLPARYGGFETLAENLVVHKPFDQTGGEITVYCSASTYAEHKPEYLGARLKYLPLSANGVSSIPYDILSLILAATQRVDAILLLGVSGAVALPFIRLVSRARIVTNIDGLEWQRPKWGAVARAFLKLSERCAVRFSHDIIADNPAIAEYIEKRYGRKSTVIPYGGDHALSKPAQPYNKAAIPPRYAFALSRIEPENNVHSILSTFAQRPGLPLIYIGNWDANSYARRLKKKYDETPHLHLLAAEYDLSHLRSLREGAEIYIHGHSAGGTNPSLVEMMHFGCPVLAYECAFNRHTTKDQALYFSDEASLKHHLDTLSNDKARQIGDAVRNIAQEDYVWSKVAHQYFERLKLHG